MKDSKKFKKALRLNKISIAALNHIKGGLPPKRKDNHQLEPDGNSMADCSWTGCNGWACETDYCQYEVINKLLLITNDVDVI